MVAGVVFAVVLTLTLVRSILVVDAVTSPPGVYSCLAARATHAVSSRIPVDAAQGRSGASPQQRGSTGTSTAVRTLHNRLLAMHIVAAAFMMTGTAKYHLPVSTLTCRVTGALLICTILLYDASLVLFLLAKISVTNGSRALSRWETYIRWWSRFYGWVYLPWLAITVALTTASSVNDEGTTCLSGSYAEGESAEFSDEVVGYLSNNAILIVQFVLLLAMFVKPMLMPQGSTQSGGAVYRRVVIRNIVCTAGIVLIYTGTTLIVILKWLSDGTGMEEVTIKPTRLPVVMLQYVSSTMPIPQNPGSNENFQTMPESSTTFY